VTAEPADADDPSLDVSALYGLPPEEFTAARNDLVKRLRAAGRKDEASRVGRMRKPPVTAWALNQMARQRPDVVALVFEAGGGLRAAMDAALAGDSSGVRPARQAEREALNAALAEASRQLDDTGHPASEAARRRMEATLRAAMVNESVAEALSQGTLDVDHDAPGFGFDGSAPVLPPDTSRGGHDKAARDEVEKAEREKEEEARQAATLRARLTENAERLAQRARELERAALDAEAAAQTARQAAEEARTEADEARQALMEAGEAS
jgi:hypothetical protein